MAKTSYRAKYIDMRTKFLEATDVAYRLGYADGIKEGQQQAQQQMEQQQMEEEQQALAAQGGGGGMPPEEGGMPPEEGGMPPEEGGGAQPDDGGGDTMDHHISELQNLVAKGEKPKVIDLRVAVKSLVDLRKAQKNKLLSSKQNKTHNAQKDFVDSIIKSFNKDSKSVTANLETIVKQHGLKLDDKEDNE